MGSLLLRGTAAGIDSMRGTLPWIAPEIIKSPDNVTEAVSRWSLAVFCSSGSLP
jgi:serine/threonine protein kinase